MENRAPKNMGAVEWLMLIVLSIIWGGSFFFNEIALSELPVMTLVTGRLVLGGLALNVITYVSGRRLPRSLKTWGAFLLMGVLNNLIPIGLIVWGQTKIAGGLASILNATTPLFTVILAHFLTRDEQITFGKLLGIVIGLLGVTVMIGPEVFKGFDLNVLAELAVIGAAVSYALAGIFGRRFKELSPFVTATGQVSASAVVLLLIALFSHDSLFTVVPSPTAIGAVAALGLVCTAAAYMLYFRILASSGATNVLLVTLLIPVSALLLGTTILGEKIAPQDLAGMALIALGLGAIDGRILSFVRPNRSSGKIEEKP